MQPIVFFRREWRHRKVSMGAPDCQVTSLAVAVSATPVFSACASCGTHGSVDATNVFCGFGVLWFSRHVDSLRGCGWNIHGVRTRSHPQPRGLLAPCRKPYRTRGVNQKPCVLPRSRLRLALKSGPKVFEGGFVRARMDLSEKRKHFREKGAL